MDKVIVPQTIERAQKAIMSHEQCFLVVEPSKIIIFLREIIMPQKEDIILLYIGYHSIPK